MARLPPYLRRSVRLFDVHSHAGVELGLYLTHGFPYCQSLRSSFEENEAIGCDLVVQKSKIYESGRAKIPSDYRDPPKVFAELARRFPNHFMWGTDNPAHTWVSNSVSKPGGKPERLALWSSMARERQLLTRVSGALRRKVAYENALRFIEG